MMGMVVLSSWDVGMASNGGGGDANPPPGLTDGPIQKGSSVGYLPDTWSVTPQGAFAYALPFEVPAGRAGMAPLLSLNYVSNGGNSLLGLGFSLSGMGSSITRCAKSLASEGAVDGVHFTNSDALCLDGQKLITVPSNEPGVVEYRTQSAPFARIKAFSTVLDPGSGPAKFAVETQSGHTLTYEAVEVPRLTAADGAAFSSVDVKTVLVKAYWHLTRDEDASGNWLTYEYETLSGGAILAVGNLPFDPATETLLTAIRYTSHSKGLQAERAVTFEYEARPDVSLQWESGVAYRMSRRVQSVRMWGPSPVKQAKLWQYDFDYDTSVATKRSRLVSVKRTGALGTALWAKQFQWSDASAAPDFSEATLTRAEPGIPRILLPADVNGDGADDLLYHVGGEQDYNQPLHVLVSQTGSQSIQPLAQEHLLDRNPDPFRVDLASSYAVDFNSDGRTGLFAAIGRPAGYQAGPCAWAWWHWDGASFIPQGDVTCDAGVDSEIDLTGYSHQEYHFGDLDGDGLTDTLYAIDPNGNAPSEVEGAQGPEDGYRPVWAVQLSSGAQLVTTISAQCGARITDLDGDGRAELVTTQGDDPDGPQNFHCTNTRAAIGTDAAGVPVVRMSNTSSIPLSGSTNARYGDFNGDGLEDFVALPEDVITDTGVVHGDDKDSLVFFNTGHGFYASGKPFHIPVDVPQDNPNTPDDNYLRYLDKGVRIADVNRDGRADIAVFHNAPQPGIAFLISQGDGSFTPMEVPLPSAGTRLDTMLSPTLYVSGFNPDKGAATVASEASQTPADGWKLSQFGDFNGDGFIDVVRIAQGQLELRQQMPILADRIIGVYDEPTLWPRETIAYSTEWSDDPAHKMDHTCSYPLSCVRSGLVVARSVTSRANLLDPMDADDDFYSAHAVTTYYTYEDPVSDLRGNGFLGFGEFRTWNAKQAMQTVTTFDHRVSDPSGQRYPFAGRPKTVWTMTPILTAAQQQQEVTKATARLSKTTYTDEYRTQGLPAGTHAVFPQTQITKVWEGAVKIAWHGATGSHVFGDGLNEPSDTLTTTVSEQFDAYGHRTHQESQSSRLGQTGRKDWVDVNIVHDPAGTWSWQQGLPLTQTSHSQINGEEVVRTVDTGFDDRARPWRIEVEKNNPNPDLRSTTTLTYDDYGVVTSRKVEAPGVPTQITHIEYDPYPDPVQGAAPDERVYPSRVWAEHQSNGQVSDLLGITTRIHPGYGVPIQTVNAANVATYAIYDDLGRPLWLQRDGEQAATLSYAGRADQAGGYNGLAMKVTVGSQTQMLLTDGQGKPVSRTIRGFDGQDIHTRTIYDDLGRVIASSRPYQAIGVDYTQYAYDSLNRVLQVTSPDGSHDQSHYMGLFQTEHVDAQHHTSYQHLNVDGELIVSGNLVSGQPAIETQYAYGPFGVLKTVTDPKSNLTSFDYDTLGRRIQTSEPDRGVTQTFYNGLGEVRHTHQTHDGQDYDSIFERDDLGRVTTQTSPDGTSIFTWDESPNGLGQLAWTTSADQIRTTYRYDSLGRPAGVDLLDPEKNVYSTDLSYDAQGRLATMAYPKVSKPERFTVQYGYNSFGYLETVQDATPGQPKKPLWTVTQRNTDLALIQGKLGDGMVSVNRDYDPVTGRLKTLNASTPAQADLFHLDYDYWANGLIKGRSTQEGNQLRTETFAYDALNRLTEWKLGTTTTSYGYDTIGNLTDILRNSQPIEHRNYGQNGGLPHALTQLIQQPNTANAVTQTYRYDDLGRLFNDDHRKIGYSAFDLPKTLSRDGATWGFLYDADGRRIRKTGAGRTTTYLPGLYEKREAGNVTTHVFHVMGTDGAHIEVNYVPGSGDTVRYPITDALGSVTQVVEADGTVSAHTYYDPFGQRINADGGAYAGNVGPVTEGFTGQEHDDEMGIINFKGRLYDPAMKRFLSPDPIVSAPGFSQSWNPYSNVMNSPLNLIDPSGLEVNCWATPGGPNDMECDEPAGPPAPAASTGQSGQEWEHIKEPTQGDSDLTHSTDIAKSLTNDGSQAPGVALETTFHVKAEDMKVIMDRVRERDTHRPSFDDKGQPIRYLNFGLDTDSVMNAAIAPLGVAHKVYALLNTMTAKSNDDVAKAKAALGLAAIAVSAIDGTTQGESGGNEPDISTTNQQTIADQYFKHEKPMLYSGRGLGAGAAGLMSPSGLIETMGGIGSLESSPSNSLFHIARKISVSGQSMETFNMTQTGPYVGILPHGDETPAQQQELRNIIDWMNATFFNRKD